MGKHELLNANFTCIRIFGFGVSRDPVLLVCVDLNLGSATGAVLSAWMPQGIQMFLALN